MKGTPNGMICLIDQRMFDLGRTECTCGARLEPVFSFRVEWAIDIDHARNPLDAARQALDTMTNQIEGEALPPVFETWIGGGDGEAVRVDFADVYEEEAIRRRIDDYRREAAILDREVRFDEGGLRFLMARCKRAKALRLREGARRIEARLDAAMSGEEAA